MKISPEEVKYVAGLARLDLSQMEVEDMTRQLDRILSYIDKLDELATGHVKPTIHAIPCQNAFREDVVGESLPQKTAVANGPLQNGEAFVVPKVI